ncbi:TetR/AcrR family transcriptional regulator [Ramlibacter pallidus]|nr:TetR/AcrR family transcriptional regulator [Ramlibacter pallidus]
MPDIAALSADPGIHQHRSRLLEGMAIAVGRKGYAETTIADIVREASVSRRTFYEHFATKAECLVALYEAASHNALKVLRQAVDPARDWQEQAERAIGAYLSVMAANPVLMRTLFIEILHLGPEGLAARRRVNAEIADYMVAVVNGGRGGGHVSPQMAMAVVGGIHELVLQAIEDGKAEELPQLTQTAAELVKAVARSHP